MCIQAPEAKGDGKKQLSAGERQMRALKIGAAAAGGGAILALTGEIPGLLHLSVNQLLTVCLRLSNTYVDSCLVIRH